MQESQGRIPAACSVFSRRTVLTLGLAAGTGAALGRPIQCRERGSRGGISRGNAWAGSSADHNWD